jgi:hypothetical protein
MFKRRNETRVKHRNSLLAHSHASSTATGEMRLGGSSAEQSDEDSTHGDDQRPIGSHTRSPSIRHRSPKATVAEFPKSIRLVSSVAGYTSSSSSSDGSQAGVSAGRDVIVLDHEKPRIADIYNSYNHSMPETAEQSSEVIDQGNPRRRVPELSWTMVALLLMITPCVRILDRQIVPVSCVPLLLNIQLVALNAELLIENLDGFTTTISKDWIGLILLPMVSSFAGEKSQVTCSLTGLLTVHYRVHHSCERFCQGPALTQHGRSSRIHYRQYCCFHNYFSLTGVLEIANIALCHSVRCIPDYVCAGIHIIHRFCVIAGWLLDKPM